MGGRAKCYRTLAAFQGRVTENMFTHSNLLRTYSYGQTWFLDMTLSIQDMKDLKELCAKNKRLSLMLADTLAEAEKEIKK
jgi:hypothetical protein